MDKDKRMVEMEALLQIVLAGGGSQSWVDRARAILTPPPPDPDARANEVRDLFFNAKCDWRAVAAWADKRVREARIAGLREALEHTGSLSTLIAKAEAENAQQ